MCIHPSRRGPSSQAGASLVELLVFIVVVSIAVAGVLLVMNKVTAHSADALVHKQSLSIAESLLEEVELMPFTFCDPDDASAVSATSSAGCTIAEGLGPETIGGVTEDRYGTLAPAVNAQFDNVNDYNGFGMATGAGIRDITGNAIAGLSGYAAQVVVAPSALGDVPAAESLLITVTVTGPDGSTVALDGYRTRYAPNGT
jgi:MSHA pilin protein MshD